MVAADHPEQGEERARLMILAALGGAIFAGAASMRILDALLPNIAHHYGHSVGTSGLAVSAYSGSYSICQLLYGHLGDRHGPYRIVMLAAICSALAALGCAFAPTLGWLALLRLIAGGVAAAIGPLSLAWVSHATTTSARPVVVANVTGASIVGATAGQVGGGLIGEMLNWQASFLLIAGFFALSGFALLRAGARHPHLQSLGQRAAGPQRNGAQTFRALLRRRTVRITLVAVGVEGFATYMSFTYIATLLRDRFELAIGAAGIMIALFGLGGIAFVLAARAIVDRLPDSRRGALGGILMGLGFLLLTVAPSRQWAGGALFILGIGFFMFHNILQVRATTMAPDAPAAGISLFAATFFLAQAAGAMIGGWTVDLFGPAISCVVSSLILMGLGVTIGRFIGERPGAAR